MGHSFLNVFRVLIVYHVYYISSVGGDVNESYFQAPSPTRTASLTSSTNGRVMPTLTNPMTCNAPSAPQWTLSCEPNPVIACDATQVRAGPWLTPEIQVSGPSSPKTTCNSPAPLPPLLQGKSTIIPPPSKGTLVPILHPIEGSPTLSSLSPTQTSLQPLIEETSTPTQTMPTDFPTTTPTPIPPTLPPTLPPIPPTSASAPHTLPPILASFFPIPPPLPFDQRI